MFDEKNKFYKHFFNLLVEKNPKNISASAEIKFQHLLEEAEKIIQDNITEAHIENIDCKKGCGYCCILNIPTLLPETHNIANFVKTNFSSRQLNNVKQKIIKYGFQIRNLDDDERIACKKPCTFLSEEESCSIYPVRPILCRSVTSASALSCKQAMENAIMDEESPVLMNLFIKDLYNDFFLAFSDFLAERGIENKSTEITQAIKQNLEF